jgi:hypothetical protein
MGVGGWKIFLVASTSDYHALDNDATLPFFREKSNLTAETQSAQSLSILFSAREASASLR